MSGAITATTVAVAAMTTSEIFTAVAITGAVLGAVGAATGIKPLQYAGMALGAIGGIGALAVSAGVIGADALGTASAAGGLTSVGADAGADVGTIGADAGADAGAFTSDGGFAGAVGADVAPGGSDIIDTVSGAVTTPDAALTAAPTNALSPDVSPVAATDTNVLTPTGDTTNPALGSDSALSSGGPGSGAPGGALSSPGDTSTSGLVNSTPAAPSVASPTAPAAPGTAQATAQSDNILAGGQGVVPASGTNLTNPTVTGAVLPTNAGVPASFNNAAASAVNGVGTVTTTAAPAAGSTAFSNILDFLGKPGVATLAAGAIQAGASFVAGATSSLTPAQVAALNAQAQANQAAANMSALQQANIKSGIPVASRTAPAGLVNQTPPPSPPVTGATA